ncbi:MAG: hypothetical protein GVY22_18485 [Gammaproteobacteria bacterium]|jgi:hypothetical protein|nr:hypothetical protein [Gammaproteobacteria bacterium]
MKSNDTASLARRCTRIESSTEVADLIDFLADIDAAKRHALEHLLDEIERTARAYLADEQLDADVARKHAA